MGVEGGCGSFGAACVAAEVGCGVDECADIAGP